MLGKHQLRSWDAAYVALLGWAFAKAGVQSGQLQATVVESVVGRVESMQLKSVKALLWAHAEQRFYHTTWIKAV